MYTLLYRAPAAASSGRVQKSKKLIERINRTGTTVIVATHDREMVDSMHRRVIALEGGHVIRDQERGGYGNYGTN